jgi:chromate transporter
MPLLRLFLIFVKIGAILLGGGYVIFPIMSNEFVEKRQLIKQDELVDYFALSQSLPGIIAANMTIFIGYKLKGKLGAIAAMLGVIFVPFWTILILAAVLNALVSNSCVQGGLRGVGIAVIALIMLTVREVWQKSKRGIFFYIIFLGALISLLIFKLTPVQTILIFSVIGILVKSIRRQA